MPHKHAPSFDSVELIAASPSYLGEGARRSWAHIREIIAAAANEGPDWPFDLRDPPAIVKTKATEPMVGKRYQERKANAQGDLRAALSVPDPGRVSGRTILVVDDVFTDGLTLNEVARALHGAGAEAVYGVTLARQPFRG